MHNNRSNNTIHVLPRVVRMPPTRAIQLRSKRVRHRPHRRNGTLGNAGNTIVPRRTRLQETVPVYRGTFGDHVVFHCNLDPVTPIRFDHGTGKLTIDSQEGEFDTVGG